MVRVSRRVASSHYASIQAIKARSSVPGWPHCTRGYNTPRREPRSAGLCLAAKTDAGPVADKCTAPRRGWLSARERVWLRTLPLQQFHVLFDSLSKVLFIFRSLYLCAIGLQLIFSLRWNLPPILSCIPKQLDSSRESHTGWTAGRTRDSHPL